MQYYTLYSCNIVCWCIAVLVLCVFLYFCVHFALSFLTFVVEKSYNCSLLSSYFCYMKCSVSLLTFCTLYMWQLHSKVHEKTVIYTIAAQLQYICSALCTLLSYLYCLCLIVLPISSKLKVMCLLIVKTQFIMYIA